MLTILRFRSLEAAIMLVNVMKLTFLTSVGSVKRPIGNLGVILLCEVFVVCDIPGGNNLNGSSNVRDHSVIILYAKTAGL